MSLSLSDKVKIAPEIEQPRDNTIDLGPQESMMMEVNNQDGSDLGGGLMPDKDTQEDDQFTKVVSSKKQKSNRQVELLTVKV